MSFCEASNLKVKVLLVSHERFGLDKRILLLVQHKNTYNPHNLDSIIHLLCLACGVLHASLQTGVEQFNESVSGLKLCSVIDTKFD